MLTGPDNRVLIPASALTGALYLLAMDEPVGGLDYGNQVRLLSIVRELAREGYTFIQSTHFPDHAPWMGGRVLMLNKGRVVAEGMAEKAVTSELLSELYRVPMDVTRTMCGVTVCVPEEMR